MGHGCFYNLQRIFIFTIFELVLSTTRTKKQINEAKKENKKSLESWVDLVVKFFFVLQGLGILYIVGV